MCIPDVRSIHDEDPRGRYPDVLPLRSTAERTSLSESRRVRRESVALRSLAPANGTSESPTTERTRSVGHSANTLRDLWRRIHLTVPVAEINAKRAAIHHSCVMRALMVAIAPAIACTCVLQSTTASLMSLPRCAHPLFGTLLSGIL